jgi:hypothetical protein
MTSLREVLLCGVKREADRTEDQRETLLLRLSLWSIVFRASTEK